MFFVRQPGPLVNPPVRQGEFARALPQPKGVLPHVDLAVGVLAGALAVLVVVQPLPDVLLVEGGGMRGGGGGGD